MSPEDLDGYSSFAFRFGDLLAQIYFHPLIFFILVAILTATYIVMYFLMTRENKQEAIKTGVWNQFKVYILAHMMLQMLMCFVISYFMIKFANALWENYIINWIVAPVFGLVLALIIDRSVIMKLENKSNNFVNPILRVSNSEKKEKESPKSSASDNNINNITINVGGSHHNNDSDIPVIDVSSNNDVMEIPMIEENTEEMKQITINETTEAVLASLIEIQKQQGEELKRQSEMLDAIRGSIMNDKRILLKDMIYNCINKGYATPEEDERIRIEYQSYVSLGGNSIIHALYEERFVKLPVHN